MDLKEIKELVADGGKVVIVENEKPVLVILAYSRQGTTSGYEKTRVMPPGKSVGSLASLGEEFSNAGLDEELTLDDLPLE